MLPAIQSSIGVNWRSEETKAKGVRIRLFLQPPRPLSGNLPEHANCAIGCRGISERGHSDSISRAEHLALERQRHAIVGLLRSLLSNEPELHSEERNCDFGAEDDLRELIDAFGGEEQLLVCLELLSVKLNSIRQQ